jgi:hypothetical protein
MGLGIFPVFTLFEYCNINFLNFDIALYVFQNMIIEHPLNMFLLVFYGA